MQHQGTIHHHLAVDALPDAVQTLRACSLLFWAMKPQV